MLTGSGVAPSQWEVLVPMGDKLKRKDFRDDYAEAQRVYIRLIERGHTPTLRCKNQAFPPPEKLRPFMVEVSRGVFRRKVPMKAINIKHGRLWCPYCVRLREFKKRNGFRLDGRFVNAPGLYCVCGVSHRDFHVRRWNPIAAKLYAAPPRATRSDKRGD